MEEKYISDFPTTRETIKIEADNNHGRQLIKLHTKVSSQL
jgi:hypothetical protein